MSTFLRWVDDLPALLEAGVDNTFYDVRNEDFAVLPPTMVDRVNKACLADGIGVALLKQRSYEDAEPREVFVVRMGDARGRKEWKALSAEMAAFIAQDLTDAAKGIKAREVLNRSKDKVFDAMADCAVLRNRLVRFIGKRRGKNAGVVVAV